MAPGSASDRPTVTVVGGGIAGLVAAIEAATRGYPVRLHEARAKLGGRARSADGEWAANFGPHGLVSSRPNWEWLKDNDLLPETSWISPTASRFHHEGRVRRVAPAGILQGFAHVRKDAPPEPSFAEWAGSALGERGAHAMARMAAATFSYHHDPGELSAAFVWDRLRWMFVPPAVHRVVGGWNRLVERLEARARERGVEILCDSRVETLPDAPVVVALELRDAAQLLGRELSWPTGGGVALDLGLEHRRGDAATVVDLDHGVLLQAQPAASAPKGHRLYQAHVALLPGEGHDDALKRIEEVFDHGFRGWRERVAWRRRMVVTGRTGAVNPPGTTWRDRPAIEQGDGVFLAGDAVAAEGVLSEVALTSGLEAAQRAVAHAATRR